MRASTDWVQKSVLLGVTLGLIIAFIEFAVAPTVLPMLPMKLHGTLPLALRVLAQSSKSSAVPRNYIAIVGDSNAQGNGDWLRGVDPTRNPPFHSAHVIAEQTGRDVVSFGRSGAGSLRGLIQQPFAILDTLDRTWLYAFEDPEVIVLYFYEGNDLTDNLREIGRSDEPRYSLERIRDPEVFDLYVGEHVIGAGRVGRLAEKFGLLDNLVMTRAIIRRLSDAISDVPVKEFQRIDWSSREVNRARIGGREVPLPDGLQSPPLALSKEEFDLGLYAFARSLETLRRRFPDARLILVNLPSPLMSYEITSHDVSIQTSRSVEVGRERHPHHLVLEYSDAICRAVAAEARNRGADFIDARPVIRAAAREEFVHGPLDWKHYNERGHRTLAAAVVRAITASEPLTSGCASYSEPAWQP